MREIKFRVWDTEQKEFTISLLQYLPDGSLKAEPCGILMQYTGLKDKNGKEIYEGDIVVKGRGKHKTQGEVKFVPDCGAYSIDGISDGLNIGHHIVLAFNGIANDCKVIGNIYENKELLK